MSGGIRARLEIDDGFAGFGVTEFFAGQSLHCFGVRPQGANRGVETAGILISASRPRISWRIRSFCLMRGRYQTPMPNTMAMTSKIITARVNFAQIPRSTFMRQLHCGQCNFSSLQVNNSECDELRLTAVEASVLIGQNRALL